MIQFQSNSQQVVLYIWTDELILKFTWRSKRPNTALKENKVRGLTLPDLRTYYKNTVIIKTAWVKKQTNRYMEENTEARKRPTQIYSTNI